jgi:hypothetical protein
MRAVLLEVPEVMLAERRKFGLDGRDEVWDGVLHMVPPPGRPHQEMGGELYLVLGPLAKHRGLRTYLRSACFARRTTTGFLTSSIAVPSIDPSAVSRERSWSSRSGPRVTRPTRRSASTPVLEWGKC